MITRYCRSVTQTVVATKVTFGILWKCSQYDFIFSLNSFHFSYINEQSRPGQSQLNVSASTYLFITHLSLWICLNCRFWAWLGRDLHAHGWGAGLNSRYPKELCRYVILYVDSNNTLEENLQHTWLWLHSCYIYFVILIILGQDVNF